jgi:hypothetical protein
MEKLQIAKPPKNYLTTDEKKVKIKEQEIWKCKEIWHPNKSTITKQKIW